MYYLRNSCCLDRQLHSTELKYTRGDGLKEIQLVSIKQDGISAAGLIKHLWKDKICDGKCLQSENMQCPHTKRAVRNNKPIRNNKEEMINNISVKRQWPKKEAI